MGMNLFIHSANILSAYHVPNIVSGAGDTAVNKKDQNSCPHDLVSYQEGDIQTS